VLARNNCGRGYKDCACQTVRPIRADISRSSNRFAHVQIVRRLDRCDDIVTTQLVGVPENFQGAKRSARTSIDDRGSLVIPSASVNACTEAVVHRISAASEPVNNHLPDAVFNAPKSISDLRCTVGTVQERKGRLIAKRPDRSLKPPQRFLSGSENFNRPGRDIDSVQQCVGLVDFTGSLIFSTEGHGGCGQRLHNDSLDFVLVVRG
jgi:hypothetical protein